MAEPHYIPTPEEIKAQTEAIQKTWTEEERAKRAVQVEEPCTIPHCSTLGFRHLKKNDGGRCT